MDFIFLDLIEMTYPTHQWTFALHQGSMPQEKDADPWGDILYFSPKMGWIIAKQAEAQELIEEYNCTHWSYTPEPPIF